MIFFTQSWSIQHHAAGGNESQIVESATAARGSAPTSFTAMGSALYVIRWTTMKLPMTA